MVTRRFLIQHKLPNRFEDILPILCKSYRSFLSGNFLNYLIFTDNQFGFRKNHSTGYALALLYNKISSAIDNNEVTVGIYIDLSKPFDTVNHQILLDKLQQYGIRGIAFDWFSDDLKNRQQFVQF